MTPVRIALIYLALASLWILLSDRVLYWLVAADSTSFLFWQTTKGWLFVIASSVIIYLLAYRLNWALSRQLDLKRRHLSLVRRKAYTDYLTGLPNRRFGLRVMRRLLGQAERSGKGFCVILVDLDDFKQVNDSLGHRAGDQLIVALAERLKAQLGPGEHLVRQGGDEFLMMCAGTESRHRVAARAGALLETLTEPVTLDGMELTVTASAGVACYPDDGQQLLGLMRSVDLALHHSKKYKHCFNFYQPEMATSLQHRFDLQQKLREALEEDGLEVFFQPVYEPVEGRCTGSEALVRWRTAEGFISPADFIPVAEQSGQIRKLGMMVLRKAFSRTVELIRESGQPLTISVNVSPKQFVHGYIVTDLQQALHESGIDPQCVILEITEGVLLNNVIEAAEVLNQLTDLGVAISMDDFGQGYSSLSYLRQHPFSYLKIDRSFVQGMDQSRQDRALVEASVAMAQALNLKVVAEGVETQTQSLALEGLGVDYLQGFWLARPMPGDEYRTLVLQQTVNA
ncbi:bifunctional diguanylate cyclase/phosphodiesterase [Marinimicrobium sp. LS-A18]|uniref:putative bifunctional diguanylate cyclase/phosphodiesterase n=1 Tax=Marinimicrobium sp. LS-A18 TaxID=1381596 RepID=UPI0009DC41F8|nr:EAL domain-containing protein [Marinimicrobium sp. LS-A18]